MKKVKMRYNSAKAFRVDFEQYLSFCKESKKLANIAGFCALCRISREELTALKAAFAKEFDIICSSLIDEAINFKISNSGAILQYIEKLSCTFCGDEVEDGTFRIICEHNSFEDGG